MVTSHIISSIEARRDVRVRSENSDEEAAYQAYGEEYEGEEYEEEGEFEYYEEIGEEEQYAQL